MISCESARRAYNAHPYEDMPFEDYVMFHVEHGYLHCSPDHLICGRPVQSFAPWQKIVDPRYRFAPEHCDAWYIALASSREALLRFFRYEEICYPWLGWCRRGKLRFWKRGQVLERIQASTKASSSDAPK